MDRRSFLSRALGALAAGFTVGQATPALPKPKPAKGFLAGTPTTAASLYQSGGLVELGGARFAPEGSHEAFIPLPRTTNISVGPAPSELTPPPPRCPKVYRSPECGYRGPALPTFSGVCDKTFGGCPSKVDFGGFPR